MKRFFKWKDKKHGLICIRIDEKKDNTFIVVVDSSQFFITSELEKKFKNVIKEYLSGPINNEYK